MKKLLAAAMLFMLNSWSCFSADTPRAEYPRPQFEREQWVNLNGTWTFDFDFGKSGKDRRLQSAEKFDKNITVPFCPESKLSGVGYTDFIEQMWYQRNITIPSDWNGKKIFLNFGAVDYCAEIDLFDTLALSGEVTIENESFRLGNRYLQLRSRVTDDFPSNGRIKWQL